MAVETTGSTVPRRQLGRYLRELRNRERLTVKVAAGKLEWSEAKIWRIETGQTSLRSLDVEAMCKIYGAPADLTEALARTLIEADTPGVDAEEISRRVHVRLARQPLVHRATSPLQLSVALNE